MDGGKHLSIFKTKAFNINTIHRFWTDHVRVGAKASRVAGVAKGNDCPSGIGKNDAKELISTGLFFRM